MYTYKVKIAFVFFTLLYLFSSTVIPTFAAVTYTYDANGNMTSDGSKCYTYNDSNQLSQVKNCSTNQVIANYIYDYQGNRIEKKEYTSGTLQQTVYSPSKEYETKKLANNTKQNTAYYYANNQLLAKKNPDGSKTYYHNDNLGSANILTNQSGAVAESTSYYPFGDIRSGGTQSKYLYTGQENDSETGLDYYNSRYYNSHMRRFTQPDDPFPNPYDPQQLNRYSYVNNNPMTNTDPSGHCIEDACIGEIIATVVATELEQHPEIVENIANTVEEALPAVESGVDTGIAAIESNLPAIEKGSEAGLSLSENALPQTIEDTSTALNSENNAIQTSEEKSYNSFNALKKDLGSAGPGNNWHHIVEQNKIGQFGAEAIHNTNNVVNIPAQVNFNINGYYSSLQNFTDGLRVRDWLSSQSYEEQFNFGTNILNQKLNEFYNQ